MPLIIKFEERFKHLDKISNAKLRIISGLATRKGKDTLGYKNPITYHKI